MTNPFIGRKLGARETAPQFPQRRALRRQSGGKVTKPKETVFKHDDPKFNPSIFDKRGSGTIRIDKNGNREVDAADAGAFNEYLDQRRVDSSEEDRQLAPSRRLNPLGKYKKGGKIPGLFIGGLFNSSPGSSTTSQSGSSSTSVNNPIYNDLRDTVVGQARHVVDMPFNPYTGQAVAPLNADQNTAFSNIRSNQGNYSPFFNNASSSLDRVAGYDPTEAGMDYVDQAGGMQTGTQAASPFVNQAGKTFTGSTVDDYMNPYNEQVTNRIAQLGARNLNENLLPGINATFTGGSAAQFGRGNHADVAGRALRDTQEAVLGQQSKVLQEGYGMAANIFGSDAGRAAGLAGTTGALAQGDRAGTAALGTTAGNLTAQGVNSGLATASAQQNLGQATQAAAGTDANALATSGGIQREATQQQNTFDYGQWQQGENNRVNRLQQAQSLGNGWTLPMNNQYQSTGTTTTTAPQGSPFGQILGAGMGLASLAIPGASGVSALGNIFGSGARAVGSGMIARDGGYVPEYAVGGMVPTVSMMRKINAPQPQQAPGMAPTGMPGMPPMAPAGPMMPQQPNGQMQATPFRRGGRVDCDDGWKVRRGDITARFADGGYNYSPFLQSSEGLADRLPQQPFMSSPEQRRDNRFAQLRGNNERLSGLDNEARANPAAYWQDLATQIPRGAADITTLAGIPGSVLEALGYSVPHGATMEGIEGGLDSLFGKPRGSGGEAGRDFGSTLLSLLGVGAFGKMRPAVSRLGKSAEFAGNSANIGFPMTTTGR